LSTAASSSNRQASASNITSTNSNTSSSIKYKSSQLMGQSSSVKGGGSGSHGLNSDDAKVKQFLDSKKKEFEEKFKNSGKTSVIQQNNNSCKLDDFEMDRTIGTGSFGRVMIVYLKKDRSQRFAMKMLKKDNIVKMKQVEHTLNEKKILSSIDFPFVVKLHFSFKDNSNLYMVLEYVSGGEMFTHLRKTGRYSEENTCFLASQIVLTFEYLHYLNIIYRDLKPENVLYDSNGNY
jgi:protein kinase A